MPFLNLDLTFLQWKKIAATSAIGRRYLSMPAGVNQYLEPAKRPHAKNFSR
jgi:hypothetical protein